MKTKNRNLVFIVVFLCAVVFSAVVFSAVKISDFSQEIKVRHRLETYLVLPFKVRQISEPSPLSFISGLDVIIEIHGGRQLVFNSFERRLLLDGLPVKRTGNSVGYQNGDSMLMITHITKDIYRLEEYFAI